MHIHPRAHRVQKVLDEGVVDRFALSVENVHRGAQPEKAEPSEGHVPDDMGVEANHQIGPRDRAEVDFGPAPGSGAPHLSRDQLLEAGLEAGHLPGLQLRRPVGRRRRDAEPRAQVSEVEPRAPALRLAAHPVDPVRGEIPGFETDAPQAQMFIVEVRELLRGRRNGRLGPGQEDRQDERGPSHAVLTGTLSPVRRRTLIA